MAATKCTCKQCGSDFIGGTPWAEYCSRSCKSRAAYARRPPRVRLGPNGSGRSERGPFQCQCCARSYTTTRPKGEGERFCSRDCSYYYQRTFGPSLAQALALAAARTLKSEVAALKRIANNWKPNEPKNKSHDLAVVIAEVASLVRIASWKPGRTPTVRPCRVCGAKCKGIGEYKRTCKHCSKAIRKKAKRTEKAMRRAAERGSKADKIDPILVFERDGWKCHMCGKKTPRKLRGTYEPRAPELDHVVALSLGGEHTWGNVKCSCRQCNGSKGARALGQVGFDFGVSRGESVKEMAFQT